MSLTVGSLFSGIGGFDLGLERAGMSVRWQVENNPWCQKVLAKHWPTVPRYGDIKSIDWATVEPAEVVCGGFPCQPFSVAGKQGGAADDRYLWPEVVRCLDALRPTWFIGENVPGIVKLALDQVWTDLESLGYAVQPFNIPACAIGSDQIRKRIWILAYSKGKQMSSFHNGSEQETFGKSEQGEFGRNDSWSLRGINRDIESCLDRVVNGVPHGVDRLRGLGNAVVPQIPELLGRMILDTNRFL